MSLGQDFSNDIQRYINVKLPEVPESTAMEIGEYISCRVQRYVAELYNEIVDREYKREKMRSRRMKMPKDESKED